jgi:hypothetical protein
MSDENPFAKKASTPETIEKSLRMNFQYIITNITWATKNIARLDRPELIPLLLEAKAKIVQLRELLKIDEPVAE